MQLLPESRIDAFALMAIWMGPNERVNNFKAASQASTCPWQKLFIDCSALGSRQKDSKLRHTWASMQSREIHPNASKESFATSTVNKIKEIRKQHRISVAKKKQNRKLRRYKLRIHLQRYFLRFSWLRQVLSHGPWQAATPCATGRHSRTAAG